jgi:hypothetical protein
MLVDDHVSSRPTKYLDSFAVCIYIKVLEEYLSLD